MTSLAELIDDARTGPRVLEGHLLATTESHEIARTIEMFVSGALGPIDEALFYKTSVGIVGGFRMYSGLNVVAKIIKWGASEERLAEIQKVQRHLAQIGLPAPAPLFGPERVVNGFGIIEELLIGDEADGFDVDVRRSIAFGLHQFVQGTQSLVGVAEVGTPLVMLNDHESLWPEAHDLRFDFEVTTEGAAWIDEYAGEARRLLAGVTGGLSIGHFDWRVQNLAFQGDEIVAIYDWDSLGVAPEAVIVGCAAASFSSSWARPDVDTLPTLEQMRSFVALYEEARGKPFDVHESATLDAANLWLCAYGARCQHSDQVLDGGPHTEGKLGWMRLLRERGSRAFT